MACWMAQGDLSALKMPSGRAAMIERMQALMGARGGAEPATAPTAAPTGALIAADLCQRHGERALLIEARQGSDGRLRLLAVLDVDHGSLASEVRRLAAAVEGAPTVDVIDRATWNVLQRLQAQRFGATRGRRTASSASVRSARRGRWNRRTDRCGACRRIARARRSPTAQGSGAGGGSASPRRWRLCWRDRLSAKSPLPVWLQWASCRPTLAPRRERKFSISSIARNCRHKP